MTARRPDTRISGLIEAIEIVTELEAEQSRRLRRESPRRTQEVRRVRRKAYQVAATRITTALRKLERRQQQRGWGGLPQALKEMGFDRE